MKSFEGIPQNPFSHRVRVGYIDTDQGQIVHHSAYVRWFEQVRFEWLRDKNLSYAEAEKSGTALPVVDMLIQYRKPALFDDLLDVQCWVSRLGRSLVRFQNRIVRDGVLLTEATISLACIDMVRMKPKRLPDDVYEVCKAEVDFHLNEFDSK